MTSLNSADDFDQWAPSYDEDVRQDGLFPFDGYARVLDHIIDLASVESGLPVLELGVGTGNLSRLLVDAGAELWGVDFSAEMLSSAAAKLPDAHLLQANLLEDLPSALDRRFPVIASAYVFHEFTTAEKLALLKRLVEGHLLPNGRIIIGDIAFADSAAREAARVTAGDRWDEEYYWSAVEAVSLAEQLNLTLTMETISGCAFVMTFSPAD